MDKFREEDAELYEMLSEEWTFTPSEEMAEAIPTETFYFLRGTTWYSNFAVYLYSVAVIAFLTLGAVWVFSR